MDKKEAERIVKNFELVKAFANGATIQYTERYVEPKCWADTGCPIWADNCEYRVKPKPEELFITVQGDFEPALKKGYRYDSGCINFVGGIYFDLYGAIRHANDWSNCGKPASRIFKVTEVTP